MSGGDVQLQAESNNTWRDLGAASNITAVNTDKVVTANSGTSDTDVEELGGGASVADNDVIESVLVVSDASDNSTTWTKSATTLTVDQTDPVIANTIAGVTILKRRNYKLGDSFNIV